jgi:hypothetical protein
VLFSKLRTGMSAEEVYHLLGVHKQLPALDISIANGGHSLEAYEMSRAEGISLEFRGSTLIGACAVRDGKVIATLNAQSGKGE